MRWLAALLLAFCAAALAQALEGRVVGVADGDTIAVLIDGRQVDVRLSDIDAPEKAQAFGQRARQALAALVMGRTVRIEARGRDDYGRTIGRVFVDGLDVNLEQVRNGMAWAYRKYTRDGAIIAAESQARVAGAGLWSAADQTPPWEFRHRDRATADAAPPGAAPYADPRTESRTGSRTDSPPIDLGGYFPQVPDVADAPASGIAAGGAVVPSPVHTGPRGGRYTVGASGSKSYVGKSGKR